MFSANQTAEIVGCILYNHNSGFVVEEFSSLSILGNLDFSTPKNSYPDSGVNSQRIISTKIGVGTL